MIEALNEGGNSFSQGIQLKMLITQFEEWANKKVGPDFAKIAVKGLEPAREVASSPTLTLLILERLFWTSL